jgi:hypothetical protein
MWKRKSPLETGPSILATQRASNALPPACRDQSVQAVTHAGAVSPALDIGKYETIAEIEDSEYRDWPNVGAVMAWSLAR